jgi:hypothetical protein
VQQRQKRPVPAAIIEQPLTREPPREPQAGVEPAPVAPGNQPVAAENLFGRVVAVTKRRVGVPRLLED